MKQWNIKECSSAHHYLTDGDIIIFFDFIKEDNTLFHLIHKAELVCQMHTDSNNIVNIKEYSGLIN